MYKGYIYRHWIINDRGIEKNYIGQTMQTIEQRWGKNGRRYLGRDSVFARAIKKYGWNNFNHEILEVIENESREELLLELNKLECYYIKKYNSFMNGYNSTTGGERNKLMSEAVREKQSEARKKYCASLTDEERKEKYGHARGKKVPENVKRKTSESVKKTFQNMSEEERKVKYKGLTGKTHTKETKEKMSKTAKNRSSEYRNKMSEVKGTKVMCINTGKIFNSYTKAGEWVNNGENGNKNKMNRKIAACCKNEREYAGVHPITGEKLKWKYTE